MFLVRFDAPSFKALSEEQERSETRAEMVAPVRAQDLGLVLASF